MRRTLDQTFEGAGNTPFAGITTVRRQITWRVGSRDRNVDPEYRDVGSRQANLRARGTYPPAGYHLQYLPSTVERSS